MKTSVLLVFIVLTLLVVAFTGCAPASTPKPTGTPTITLAPTITGTPTSTPLPTATSTRTPLPPTPTPISLAEMEKYYPARLNETLWYHLTNASTGENGGIVSIAVIESETQQSGARLVTEEFIQPGSYQSDLDYYTISDTEVLLTRAVSKELGTDVTFTPALPQLRYPFEKDATWDAESNVAGVNQSYSYQIDWIGDLEKYKDCIRVLRSTDGELTSKTTYCAEVGPVLKEHKTSSGWLQSELTGVTSARAILTETEETPQGCVLTFKLAGFGDDESGTIKQTLPSGKSVELANLSPFPFAIINLSISISAATPKGYNIISFTGDKGNLANYILDWDGKCPKLEK